MKNIDFRIQEAQQTASRVNTKKATPRHISQIAKIRNEEKNLKSSQGDKDTTCLGSSHKI